MAKWVPNPRNLTLFTVVAAPAPGFKTTVSIYAETLPQAKKKVETMLGFTVLSGKAA